MLGSCVSVCVPVEEKWRDLDLWMRRWIRDGDNLDNHAIPCLLLLLPLLPLLSSSSVDLLDLVPLHSAVHSRLLLFKSCFVFP